MSRFAAWAKNQVPEPEVVQAPLEEADSQQEGKQPYLLDNSKLQSLSRGVRFRRSPELEDKCRVVRPAQFGTVIHGWPHGSDWVRVKRNRYLPVHLGGATILIQAWWLDNEEDEDTGLEKDRIYDESHVLGKLMNLYNNSTEPNKRIQAPTDMEAFETSAMQPGTGALYTVVAEKVIIRAAPSVDTKLRNYKRRGDSVELFEWDPTRMWRRCYDADIRITGWVMLDHPELGPLLRPVGFAECLRPIPPVCAAALENNTGTLRQFIAEGMSINAVDGGGLSALALAAERGHLECCVHLLQARANADIASIAAGPARVLIQGLSGQTTDFNIVEFDEAMDSLSPSSRTIAELLFEEASALQEAFVFEEASSPSAAAPETGAPEPVEPEPADSSPSSHRNDGVEYEVMHEAVWIRVEPSTKGAKLGIRSRGQIVKMFEFDDSRDWRKVHTGGSHQNAKELYEPAGSGWMLVRHPTIISIASSEGSDSAMICASMLQHVRRSQVSCVHAKS